MMTAKEIRQRFLDFFQSKGHTIVNSAPMVVRNDPTLMFTNAGMNQFKDIFLGNSAPKATRVADAQKCLRVSGKHNDLEVVGHDGYHHTMFEMLGNWSFGDYFKDEAIDWAWELLTEVYGIDRNRLYATVFEGDPADGTAPDEEARLAWRRHLPDDRILPGDRHDNFWEMGDTGPCGPCSEIHIDLRPDAERAVTPGAALVNQDHPLVIEIWNLVFMQYNRKADNSLELLPNQNIDTGMGFERLCMVLQGKTSNYDTDVFTGLIGQIETLSGHQYRESEKTETAMRVIADHVRAIAFSIADGQLPSNVKAGYVIRRILRRAVRYGYTFLGFNEPFLCSLVDRLAEDMGEAYPGLSAQKEWIKNIIREEEMAFLRTLDRGIRLIEDYMGRAAATREISGKDAFTLYDTFGFPVDLTSLIALENGYTVDLKGFEAEMQRQKDRARSATANRFGDWIGAGGTEEVEFTGYDHTDLEDAVLTKYRTVEQKNRTLYELVFDRTPFYAEMGGQVGDTGHIVSESGEKIRILNTVKENHLTIHLAERLPSDESRRFSLHVDRERRTAIAANHTATHLLDHALRAVLGPHVEQKGSYVCADYLRFDFSHFSKLTEEELSEVERRVNALIREDFPIEERRDATMAEAKAEGAIALFGEKYGERVRTVRFGPSIELCGGTHAAATGRIGCFKILSESAIAAGVRRIEAVTGAKAEAHLAELEQTLRTARSYFNNVPDLGGAIRKMIEENAAMKKELEEVEQARTAALAEEMEAMAETAGPLRLIRFRQDTDPVRVRNAAALLRKRDSGTVLAGAFVADGRPQLILMYTEDLVQAGKNAGRDIREAAKLISGGGGGQPGLAVAGGKSAGGTEAALDRLVELALK